MRVLLVDDAITNRLVVARFLEALGHEVIQAIDGEQAIATWETRTFDLVIMDIEMPKLDGLEATRQLRARGASVPVLGFTAHDSLAELRRCRNAGMNGFLRKPVERAQLEKALEAAMRTEPKKIV